MPVFSHIVLWLALFTPAVGLAESLRMELPEHRVLSSSETESFEAALAEQLGVELGRPVQFGVSDGQVGVRVEASQQRGVTTYYRAVPAALVPTEAGPAAWADLRNPSASVPQAPMRQCCVSVLGHRRESIPARRMRLSVSSWASARPLSRMKPC